METDGGEAKRREAAVAQRRAAAMAQRRDWLQRWHGGEIGGTVTLWRDGEEMENRKTGKSMEAVARLEAMVDSGVIGGDGGRWRDGVRVRAWIFAAVLDNGGKTKRIEWCCARQF